MAITSRVFTTQLCVPVEARPKQSKDWIMVTRKAQHVALRPELTKLIRTMPFLLLLNTKFGSAATTSLYENPSFATTKLKQTKKKSFFLKFQPLYQGFYQATS